MAIDNSIYFKQQSPNIMGSIQKGLSMRDFVDQRNLRNEKLQEQKRLKDLMKKNVTQDNEGNFSLNKKAYLSDLYKENPTQAYQKQQAFQKDDKANEMQELKTAREKLELGSKLLLSAYDQPSWEKAVSDAERLGIVEPGKMQKQFDPELQKQMMMQNLTAKERLDQVWKEKDYGLKKKELGIKAAKSKMDKKKLSTTQGKQLGLFKSGLEAEKQYRKATTGDDFDPTAQSEFLDRADTNSWYVPEFVNELKSEDAVNAASAQSAWVESFLRDASGAAIPPSERMAYAKDFFPRPGDTQTTIENKARLRKQKMENAMVSSGQYSPDEASMLLNNNLPDNYTQKTQSDTQKRTYKTNEIDWAD